MGRIRTRSSGPNPTSGLVKTTDYDFSYPYGDGPWLYPSNLTVTLPGDPDYEEVCQDETHPGPPYRSGGPFSLYRAETNQQVPLEGMSFTKDGVVSRETVHAFYPSQWPSKWHSAGLNFNSIQTLSKGDPSNLGATAWSRFQPVRSTAGLGQFIAEFRDMPRTLRTTALSFKKIYQTWRKRRGISSGRWDRQIANEWVNSQFGWAPFVRDLRDFYEATISLEERVKQLKRDNGQWVKRGGTVESDSETEVVYQSSNAPLTPTVGTQFYSNSQNQGDITITRSEEKHVWFTARFRYWIPDLDPTPWDLGYKAIVYGLVPSPELVWELTPWSWLIDWMSNAGDVISNLSNILMYGLCAKYAYIMGTWSETVTVSQSSHFVNGSRNGTWTSRLIAKHRYPASPFGFGLSSSDFSTWQWSILGALGLSRLRRY